MLRWLVVGIGDIATKRVIPAIQEEQRSTLAALVTRQPEKASLHDAELFTDLDEALQRGNFEAVYIATPVFLHATQTIQALRAGKHVLCEKPMGMNFSEAQSMTETAKQCGRYLGIAYYRRLYPKVRRALELIGQGKIGQPLMAFASCHSELPTHNANRSWLLDPKRAGGGPLYDIASHRIDLLNYFFGEPHEVRACLSNAVHSIAVEDSATVLIQYANGVHAIVDVRWNSRISRDEFRIVGTEGEIDLSPLNGSSLVWPGRCEQLPPHKNLHFPCIKNFVDAVHNDEVLLSSGSSALLTDWVTEKAVANARISLENHANS